MAAHPISKKINESIVLAWRVGQLSQQDIADKYKVSKGYVNKLCKGVNQDGSAVVTAGVVYKQALAAHDDRMVTAVTEAVEEKTKHVLLFRTAHLMVARTATNKLHMDGTDITYQDLSAAATALTKAQDAVLGKQPDSVVNVGVTQQTVIQSPSDIKERASRLIAQFD
ncbi:MAG: hypothetical protein WCL29_04840 [Pseudomonadota bacterium]